GQENPAVAGFSKWAVEGTVPGYRPKTSRWPVVQLPAAATLTGRSALQSTRRYLSELLLGPEWATDPLDKHGHLGSVFPKQKCRAPGRVGIAADTRDVAHRSGILLSALN